MNDRRTTATVITAERASQLVFDQLELVMQGRTARAWARPVLAIALAFIFSRSVAWPSLTCWLALTFAGCIPPIVTDRYFLARSANSTVSATQWQWLFCLSHGSYAAAWTSLVYFLWLPGHDFNHGMIMMALGCSASAVVPLFGACRPLSLTILAIFGSGFLGSALFGGKPDYQAFSLVILVYLGLIFFMLRQVHATAKNNLLLGYVNSDLLLALASANQVAEHKRAEAEHANHSKSQFLANMSHELRTPLNAIIGFSEIIKGRILGDNIERNVEYAGLIHSSGMHLLTLINDVLDLAKIEAGSFELVEREVALDGLIAECVCLLRNRAQDGGCMLIEAAQPGLPSVHADQRALKQILLNLLSNALKFTLPGGTVTAFARQEADGSVTFGVADTGVGIAAQDQAKVFEKFGQGRHAHLAKEGGTGLGLSIVQGLIRAHGGDVRLESVEHKGTTVTVMLPAGRTMAQRTLLPLSNAG